MNESPENNPPRQEVTEKDFEEARNLRKEIDELTSQISSIAKNPEDSRSFLTITAKYYGETNELVDKFKNENPQLGKYLAAGYLYYLVRTGSLDNTKKLSDIHYFDFPGVLALKPYIEKYRDDIKMLLRAIETR